mgnify:CR=1 FL=1|tara:strand:- start:1504 stop:1965 length:462 start_codon:yes stop_codon:yes gene_type:complete
MNWITGSNKQITFYEILQKIKSHNKLNGHVYVGTDSLVHKDCCVFTTSIVLLGAKNQHGGLYFYTREKYNEPTRLYNRILREVEKTINLAIRITEVCPDVNLEVHLDISPEEKNEKTSQFARSLMGYAAGSGFKCKMKPEAFAASVVADRHTK